MDAVIRAEDRTRQAILTDGGPHLSTILDEYALRHSISGPDTMRDHLAHLAQYAYFHAEQLGFCAVSGAENQMSQYTRAAHTTSRYRTPEEQRKNTATRSAIAVVKPQTFNGPDSRPQRNALPVR
ncbi:Scr1 family TA system antitoxin-like transcriptional regulator [Nonomuraea fuscirosea]|uniref:Scr1 family TA system antitoxin-like transcriptional regulator n=1 Tax=Nonomuraea fuscirosea TaxID=1291556 RepID=UPI00343D006C